MTTIHDIHSRAWAGDPSAQSLIEQAQMRAQFGDPKARTFIGALERVDAERRVTRVRAAVQDLYRRYERRDPAAVSKVKQVLHASQRGHAGAADVANMLVQIRRQKRALAGQGPGAPRTGAYPMPYRNRVGVAFGAEEYLPLTPSAIANLLALAQNIIASASRPQEVTAVARPTDLPIAAPAPRLTPTMSIAPQLSFSNLRTTAQVLRPQATQYVPLGKVKV